MSRSARTVASFGKAGFGSMSKRMALLIVSVWLALYAGQVLIRAVLDFIGASVVGSAWVLVLWSGALAVAAAWLIGLWRGLAGRRLALTAVVSALSVLAASRLTGPVVVAILPMSNSRIVGEFASALFYLLYALGIAGVSWLIAGALIGFDVHRARVVR